MAFRQLDADKIVETADVLHRRIAERFPAAGLSEVCGELVETARLARARSASIVKPITWVRIMSAIIIAAIVLSAFWTIGIILLNARAEGSLSSSELVQALEAGINSIVLIGAVVFFFFTLETRIKRTRTLRAIHELRSIAHVIDMHQLTKDPERLLRQGGDTESSPKRSMTNFELSRYLDYCSEMFSICGKVAALYVQNFADSVAIEAVNDIENLTTDMSRKVWQKLVVLHADGKQPIG